MAPPKKQPASNSSPSGKGKAAQTHPRPATQHVNFPAGGYEPIDPIWLLKACALTVAAATLLAYASICLYIRHGAWQTLLRPDDKVSAQPTVPFTPVRFDSLETGNPRLTGWWIPAAGSQIEAANAPTLLFLHSGDGSLGTNVVELDELHRSGVNLFAIDYRGYGQSAGPHPTEANMQQDSAAALRYLVDTRHIATRTIVPYGVGLGAVFAATLAQNNPLLPAVVIDNPWPNAAEHVIHDPHYRFLPASFLLHDRFDLEQPLNQIEKAKLLISGGPGAAESRHSIPAIHPDCYTTETRLTAYFRSVTDPKTIVSGIPAKPNTAAPDSRLSEAVTRFLDEYLPTSKRTEAANPDPEPIRPTSTP